MLERDGNENLETEPGLWCIGCGQAAYANKKNHSPGFKGDRVYCSACLPVGQRGWHEKKSETGSSDDGFAEGRMMRGQIKLFTLQMDLERDNQLALSRIMNGKVDLEGSPVSGRDISLPNLALISGR